MTRTVSWQQPGYFGFLLCAQGKFCIMPRGITLIESTQIRWFSRWSDEGGWSGRDVAQHRPRDSKLGLKGPSDCHSNEILVKAASRGASGPSKGQLSQGIYSRGELDNNSKPKRTKAKGNPPEKHFTASKKELLTLSRGDSEEESCWWRWQWWWVRTSWANHKSMW